MAASTADLALHHTESPEEIRSYFQLDDNVTFLNHGSFGATPRPVMEACNAWDRQMERQPVEFFRRHKALLQSARSTLAAYINAEPDSLSFVVNATSGINVIARSFPLAPGDEILGTALEYGALDLTWQHLCQRFGARYVRAGIPLPFTTPEAVVDAIWGNVTERTRVIFLSHITSGTSAILPVEAICARARAEGILTVVDGAHAPGQVPLDLTAMGVDIYSGNCHKWLCAPKGTAFLYVHPDHQEWIESLTISWGWSEPHTFLTRNEQQGTRSIGGPLAVQRAIEFQREHDWDAVRADCHARLQTLRERHYARYDVTPVYPNSSAWFAQMALMELPSTAPAPGMLHDRLLDEFGIEIPCSIHLGQTCVRVSVQGYVRDDDLAALEEALAVICGASGAARRGAEPA